MSSKGYIAAALAIALTGWTEASFAGQAARLDADGGSGQSGVVGSTLPEYLVFVATDSAGNPVEGVSVAFVCSGGIVSPTSATTGPFGRVRTLLTLGTRAGPVTVTASASGLAPVTFLEAAVAGPATQLLLTSGNNQTGAVGTRLPSPCVVQAVDTFGNPVGGLSVSFDASSGTISPTSTTTHPHGHAWAFLTVGNQA
jgi:adhesin/invasin